MLADGSPGFRIAFVVLVLAAATGLVWAVWRAGRDLGEAPRQTKRAASVAAVAIALWLTITGRLAATGFLAFEPRPTMLPLLVLGLAGTVVLAFSRFGARLAAGLPLVLLVGYQAFRIPVELLLHQGYTEGLVPLQMTYLGMNFDVLTGVLALLLATLSRLGPVPRWLVAVWNLIGFGLLVNVVTIAFLSAPTPLRVFRNEPANVWIVRAPWVWLPTFLVPMALFGHLLVLRWLFAHPAAGRRDAQRAGAATPGIGGGASRGR
jgi:hypothetical protein